LRNTQSAFRHGDDWALTTTAAAKATVSAALRPFRLFVRSLVSAARRVIFGKGAHNGRPF
jgi:hypothetical protein